MNNNLPKINSYTNWGKLKEVWLGDVYPSSWYDHLESEVRDCFYELTEKTQEDLKIIQKKIEEFGVKVRRPEYKDIDLYLHPDTEVLERPQICPRDHYLVFGNNIYGWKDNFKKSWQTPFEEYIGDSRCRVVDQGVVQTDLIVSGANTVRIGKDIYLDIYPSVATSEGDIQPIKERVKKEFDEKLARYFEEFRVHLLFNGGHIDGCFAAIAPEVLLTSQYFSDYQRTFPGWANINISLPEFSKNRNWRQGPMHNGKWWVPGMKYSRAFNEHIINHALDWIGDYTETYFEVNCLVIDEKNVLVLGENDMVFRELEKHGITAHSVPFRCRTFWDGGLHCITLDIQREDTMIDLFPGRSENMYIY